MKILRLVSLLFLSLMSACASLPPNVTNEEYAFLDKKPFFEKIKTYELGLGRKAIAVASEF